MCRQQSLAFATSAQKLDHCSKPLDGDEVWDADSDSECASTVSGSESESNFPTSCTRARVMLPKLKVAQLSDRPVIGMMPLVGVLGTATTIRLDNDRLRNAIVKAHRDAEVAITMPLRNESSGQGVDFAHLLSLVKDFGDEFGGSGALRLEEQPCSASFGAEATAGVISISTPRGDNSNHPKVSEAARLRMEIAASRREADDLRTRLAVRAAEITAAKALAAKKC